MILSSSNITAMASTVYSKALLLLLAGNGHWSLSQQQLLRVTAQSLNIKKEAHEGVRRCFSEHPATFLHDGQVIGCPRGNAPQDGIRSWRWNQTLEVSGAVTVCEGKVVSMLQVQGLGVGYDIGPKKQPQVGGYWQVAA